MLVSCLLILKGQMSYDTSIPCRTIVLDLNGLTFGINPDKQTVYPRSRYKPWSIDLWCGFKELNEGSIAYTAFTTGTIET